MLIRVFAETRVHVFDRAERMMRGASTVLQTLVPNARQIFKVLAEAQLEDDEEYEGASSYQSGPLVS